MYSLLLVLVNYPSIQRRLQEEIDYVLGSRSPRFEDHTSLPYVEATVNETLRYTSIGPMAVPHLTTEDTTLQGKTVPKDTCVRF